ncbi:unnamed protein product [Soboliphyme baturini]|uniref:Transmembrane 9 superfamily member n=1 Tax=Soboliphyme baturini TaxID=241478 RepID=A0A183I9N1_9BILA|nr:unnamed protein product [Soboliphyme baturini]
MSFLQYEDSDEVVLWMNTVGPYHNRQETYPYFSLPFCAGPKKAISHYHETLGEGLLGVELEYSGLRMQFKEDIEKTVFCSMVLYEEHVEALKHAIKNYYWYQMYIDDLPIWGLVGEYVKTNEGEVFKLFTHKKFEIGFNGKHIIDVNLTTDDKKEIVVGQTIEYTYEVASVIVKTNLTA